MATEQVVLASRRDTCDGPKSQFRERAAQFSNQIVGVTSQIEAKAREIEYIDKELADLAGLEAKQL